MVGTVHVYFGVAEEARRGIAHTTQRMVEVLLVDFVPNAVSAVPYGSNGGRAGTQEWVENRVAHKAEHSNQTLSKF